MLTRKKRINNEGILNCFGKCYFDARCINDCLMLLATAKEISLAGGGGGIGGEN